MRKTRSQTARTQAENAATSSSPGHQSTSSAPIAVNPFDSTKYKVCFRQSQFIQSKEFFINMGAMVIDKQCDRRKNGVCTLPHPRTEWFASQIRRRLTTLSSAIFLQTVRTKQNSCDKKGGIFAVVCLSAICERRKAASGEHKPYQIFCIYQR